MQALQVPAVPATPAHTAGLSLQWALQVVHPEHPDLFQEARSAVLPALLQVALHLAAILAALPEAAVIQVALHQASAVLPEASAQVAEATAQVVHHPVVEHHAVAAEDDRCLQSFQYC